MQCRTYMHALIAPGIVSKMLSDVSHFFQLCIKTFGIPHGDGIVVRPDLGSRFPNGC